MDDSVSSLVQLFLVNNSIFTSPESGSNWPAYISYMPDSENVGYATDMACVYETNRNLDGRHMIDGSVQQHFNVSIKLRSADYGEGWQKAMDILVLLSETVREEITEGGTGDPTYVFDSFSTPSGIIYLGLDTGTTRRYNFELTYSVAIRQIT
jgi:hypothetical protein